MPSIHALVLASLLTSGLAVTTVDAQTSFPAPQPTPPQVAAPRPHPFLDRFNAASHDGRLTLQQAQAAHMPWVVQHFDAIDAQQKGYITMQGCPRLPTGTASRTVREQPMTRTSVPQTHPSPNPPGRAAITVGQARIHVPSSKMATRLLFRV
jgi:hypothetical protein